LDEAKCPESRYEPVKMHDRHELIWPHSDGGGARGYSILLILKRLMFLIGELEQEQSADPGEEALRELNKPCSYFDYIAGTGTGG
jgi:hypothetical protein